MPHEIKGLKVLKAANGNPEIYIYDEIGPGYWGLIDAIAIVDALKQIGDVAEIDVRLNSPGGDVFEASAIFNHLRENKAKINIKVDGLAASAASVIAMVGDKIEIAQNAMIMIHEAWTIAWGNKSELLKTADLLTKIDGNLINTYVERTGNTEADVKAWVEAETWFTAKEAVEKGFADSITGSTVEDSAIVVPKGRYRNCPAKVAQVESHAKIVTLARPPQRPQPNDSREPQTTPIARQSASVLAARVRALKSSLA
jgi:ATP-dependent Clp protease, protease subunit